MRPALLALSVLILLHASPAAAQNTPLNNCAECHSDAADEMKGSIHLQHGVSCQNCHGGDPAQEDMDAAHSAEAGFIGKPDKKQIVQSCGQCHADVEKMNFYGIRTDQLARYLTSHHGKKLFNEGDARVAACSDCHGHHNVLPAGDPSSPVHPLNVPKTCDHCHGDARLMASYGLPSDYFEKYEGSVHGRALFEKKDASVAQCASCHGSHGAVPPGVKEIGDTCGKCHANEKKYFLESVHAKLGKEQKFSECVSCHGNHDIHKPSPALYDTACLGCHAAGSAAENVGRRVSAMLQDSERSLEEARTLVKQASVEGIFVEPEAALLEEAKSFAIGMAPLQHTLSVERIAAEEAKVEERLRRIREGIEKKRTSRQRRKMMLVPIWAFILVMAAALLAKYRQLKHRDTEDRHGGK